MFRILDMTGKILTSEPLSSKECQKIVQVSDLQPGTYLIQLILNSKTINVKKVVILR